MPGGDRHSADTVLTFALAAGTTVQEAARQASVSEATVYRRLREADFRAEIAEARAAMVGAAVGKLASLSADAADTLAKLLGGKTPATVRLGAARAILEMGAKLRESEELERRVTELETALAERPGVRRVA